MAINIEIKAKCSNRDSIRTVLQSKGAVFKGVDHQIDTYFQSKQGRLKLREGNIENSLIYYQRENQLGPKKSEYLLVNADPFSSLKEILTQTMGIKVVVDKLREIYFMDNVKFHLDEVKGLGHFVEIEAIDDNGKKAEDFLFAQCQYYLNLFEIPEKNYLKESYSDLLLSL